MARLAAKLAGRDDDDRRLSPVREQACAAHEFDPAYSRQMVIQKQQVVIFAVLYLFKRRQTILANLHTPALFFQHLADTERQPGVVFRVENVERRHLVLSSVVGINDSATRPGAKGLLRSAGWEANYRLDRRSRAPTRFHCRNRATATKRAFIGVRSEERRVGK